MKEVLADIKILQKKRSERIASIMDEYKKEGFRLPTFEERCETDKVLNGINKKISDLRDEFMNS